MVQIQIAGQFLDLDPRTKLNVTINSPLFSTDTIAGSIAYDFSVPFTELNNQIFGFSNDEKVKSIAASFPCQLFYFGTPYKEGILKIKTISNAYQCYVSMDAGLLKESIADKDLSELNIEEIKVPDVKADSDYPFLDIRLPSEFYRITDTITLNIRRKIAGVDVIVNQYRISRPPTSATSISQMFAIQINSNDIIQRYYRTGYYRIPVWFNGSAATRYVDKYFWIYYNGTKRLVEVYRGSNLQLLWTEPEIAANISISGSNVARYLRFANYNTIDENIGNFINKNDLLAEMVIDPSPALADILRIKDLSNGSPYKLSVDSGFGTYWSLVDSYIDPIIAGLDPYKIAAYYTASQSLSYPDEKFVCAPVRNEKFLDLDVCPEFQKYQNNINRDLSLVLNDNTDGTRNKNVFTVFPYNNYVLEAVFALGNLKLFGGILNHDEFKTACLWNNFSNDIVLVDEINPLNQLRTPNPNIDIRQNLKGTSIKDFLYANRKTFAIDFIYRANGAVEIIFKNDVANSTEADDWSGKEIPGGEIYVEDDINGFSFQPSSNRDAYYSSQIKSEEDYSILPDVTDVSDLPTDDPVNSIRGVLSDFDETYIRLYRCTWTTDYLKTWVYFGKRIPSKMVGDGKNVIQPEIGVPLMCYVEENTLDRPNWRIVRVDKEGRSLFTLTDSIDPSPLNFMFYRGLFYQKWKNASDFSEEATPWLSTICQQSLIVTAAVGNYSLNIIGERGKNSGGIGEYESYGLYDKLWKDWCDMLLNARKVQKQFVLNQIDILQLDIVRKKYANGKMYLIESIEYELGQNDTIIATAVCWRL